MTLELQLINSGFSWRAAKHRFRGHEDLIERSRNLKALCQTFVKKWHLVTYTKAGFPRVHNNIRLVMMEQIILRQNFRQAVDDFLKKIDALKPLDSCSLENCVAASCRFRRSNLEKWSLYDFLVFFASNIFKHYLPDSTWNFLMRHFSVLRHVNKTRCFEKSLFNFHDPFLDEFSAVNWEVSTVSLSVHQLQKNSIHKPTFFQD